MKSKFITSFFFLFLAVLTIGILTGCFHKMAPSSPAAGTYNDSANKTVYTVAPWGAVTLPGKWMPGKYNKSSRQQYYYRDDTTTLTVVIAPCKNQPYAKGGLTGYDFVKKSFEIESRYQVQLLEQTPRLLVQDSANRYMIWTVRQDGIDQYFLCGVKDCTCNECSYRSFNLRNRRLTEAVAIKLLQDVFLTE